MRLPVIDFELPLETAETRLETRGIGKVFNLFFSVERTDDQQILLVGGIEPRFDLQLLVVPLIDP